MSKLYTAFKNDLPLIKILALAGVVISTYLAVASDESIINYCFTGNKCEIVTNSIYSKILGIPVSIVGIVGYLLILFISFLSTSKKQKWTYLFITTTIGVAFSLYLTYLEIFQINAICTLCIISLIIMLSIFITVLFNKNKMSPNLSSLNLLTLATILSTIVIFGATTTQSLTVPSSSKLHIDLAKHLSKVNAVMYGAYNCSHCLDQKNDFGIQAFKHINYVECSIQGKKAKPSLCLKKGIRAYPTWEIEGKFYIGRQSLKRLSDLSNFKYKK